ncbi:MAG TPA: hypothetical protein VFT16_05600, partial [Candidatus Saccharimonadales bacterium]|nr:hypothetical protein [Candidatus Saccharimonadales bacterium]
MFKQKPKILTTIRRALLLATIAVVIAVSFGMFFGRSLRATAATSSTINFQARLLTAAGNVVPDGLYNIEFKLYNASSSSGSSQGSCSGDGACVWVETRTLTNRVRVVNGYLTVNLGSVNAFGNINWDQEHWLGMNIGGTTGPSWDGEMTPRLKLTAVPYAFRAGSLVGGSGSNTTTLNTGTPSGNNTISLPAESGTLCIQSSVNCGFATASGSASYIQNQFSGVQTSSQFWISGTGRAATALQAPLFDTASAGTLAIGTTNATAINLNQDTTVASGKSLTVAGGATSLTGAASGIALTVSNSTSTGDILVLKDNTTTVMTVADGGGVTFTSSVNSSTALQVQNAAGGNVLSVNTTGSGAALSLGRSGAAGHLGSVLAQAYQGTSSSTQGFTFSSGVAAGASIVGSLTLSASSTTTVTITDTAGNTYTVDTAVASGSVTSSYIFSSNVTNTISAGDTLTIQLVSGTGRWLVTANAFGNFLTPSLDRTSTNTANSTTMTTGVSATTTSANELVFATFGFGSGRTYTPGAGFTGIAQLSTTAGSNDRSTGSEWKYITSTGAQEGIASISSAGVYSAALATYRSTNPSLSGLAGSIQMSDGTSSNNSITLGTNSLTAGRTILLPDESGTLCIQGSSSCVGLQQAYNGSAGGATPEIKLDGTRAGVDIQDADTTIGASASLFAVRSSSGAGLGNAMFQIQGSGAATFKNAANSTTAFSIQDASSNSMFNVDTSNGRVGIGGVATFSKFEVIGGDAAIYNNGGNPRLVLGDSTA